MSHVLYRCPRTRLNVQAWLGDEPPPDPARDLEVVSCPACAQFHFINRKTGRLHGDPQG